MYGLSTVVASRAAARVAGRGMVRASRAPPTRPLPCGVAVAKRLLATATDAAGVVPQPAVEGSPVVAAAADQAAGQARTVLPPNPLAHTKKPGRVRFADPERKTAMAQARKYRKLVHQLTHASRLGRYRRGLYRQASAKMGLQQLKHLPVEMRSFVQARAMLWRPAQEQLYAYLQTTGTEVPEASEDLDVEAWISGELPYEDYYAAMTPSELEAEVDHILWPIWQGLSPEDRSAALLQVRYECIRRLGWRTGFTSGYPVPSEELIRERVGKMEAMIAQVDSLLAQHEENKAAFVEQSKELEPAKLQAIEAEENEYVRSLQKRQAVLREQIEYLQNMDVTNKADMLPELATSVESQQVALSEFLTKGADLDAAEEQEAFIDWMSMTPAQRNEEFHAAWHNRDRSLVYVDNAQVNKVFDMPMARWYQQPERAGHLEFLPDLRIRMVKNFTPQGKPYDAWKATFRTTVEVDKHQLRSYLLAVYGLRTTFIRSMVYRPKIKRDPLTGSKTRSGGRRSFKKFEVGLLEPFIWPEVMPSFEKSMSIDDIAYERGKMLIKGDPFRRETRWRGLKLPKAADAVDSTGAVVASIPMTLMTRRQGIPSANVKHILTAIHHRKLQDEAAVAEKASAMLEESQESS